MKTPAMLIRCAALVAAIAATACRGRREAAWCPNGGTLTYVVTGTREVYQHNLLTPVRQEVREYSCR